MDIRTIDNVISVIGQDEIKSHEVGGRNITLDVHAIDVNGDEIGQLMNDFRQTDSDKIHYAALAKGVKHFKDTEKGREQMCEAVEKYAKEYAKEYAVKEKMISVKNLMENMKLTVDQALNALGIQGDERKTIINQLQNRN